MENTNLLRQCLLREVTEAVLQRQLLAWLPEELARPWATIILPNSDAKWTVVQVYEDDETAHDYQREHRSRDMSESTTE